MSSPFSNLKRIPKVPLPGYLRNFPLPTYPETEQKALDNLLEDVASNIASQHYHSQENLPEKLLLPLTPKSSSVLIKDAKTPMPRSPKEAPSDKELMSLMMGRISTLEAKICSQSKELTQKHRTISQLEEKLKFLQQKNDDKSPGEMSRVLKMQCAMLQRQVQEMEDFLYDYGLIWVGEADAVDENIDCSGSRGSKENHVWKPGESVLSSQRNVDYDVVLQKIKELNVLVGDGVAKVNYTKDGARLKYPDPVQLTLYKNGILMFDGPFRPLSDVMTRHCLFDIMEGYFPSELQARFPDGVPFKVTDKREVYYEDTRHREHFPGVGKALDNPDEIRESDPENIPLVSTSEKFDHLHKVVNERPGQTLSVNQFVEKLPPCVIKNGKVIDIRQSIWSRLKDDTTQTQVSIVNTEATREMKERLQSPLQQRPVTSESTATLRVKSESGDRTYVLKMRPQETIADLRKYLDGQRTPDNSSAYQILSTFPRKVLDDDHATIQDCGLTPSATLRLKFLSHKTY